MAGGHCIPIPKGACMRFTAARRVWLGLLGALLLAVTSSGVALLFALRSEHAYKDIITRNQEQSAAIYELEIALLEQGGLTASYLLDGSPRWLEELNRRKPYFENRLAEASQVGLEFDELAFLTPIRQAYDAYERARDQVIGLHDSGNREQARRVLLAEMATRYDEVYRLCEALSENNAKDIELAIASRQEVARRVSLWVGISLVALAGLIVGVAWYLIGWVFRPLRRITEDARVYLGAENPAACGNEIQAVGACMATFKSSMAKAHSDLTQSNRRLLDAEQLALVGRLAAGVAHEVRSPLTSLKLRLFSMQKALGGDVQCQHDAQVMSEQLSRLDGIVRTFLEFSRPPKLRVQPCDVTLLLDKALELLRFKLDAANVSVRREERSGLAPVLADPQQFQQVLINLFNNAIDAQPNGGSIQITTTDIPGGEPQRVTIRIADTGPGVPPDVADRIFNPFFSGKDDGVGLGLWIAHRIVTEHGGSLELESSARGAVFALSVPVAREECDEQDHNRGRRLERAVRV